MTGEPAGVSATTGCKAKRRLLWVKAGPISEKVHATNIKRTRIKSGYGRKCLAQLRHRRSLLTPCMQGLCRAESARGNEISKASGAPSGLKVWAMEDPVFNPINFSTKSALTSHVPIEMLQGILSVESAIKSQAKGRLVRDRELRNRSTSEGRVHGLQTLKARAVAVLTSNQTLPSQAKTGMQFLRATPSKIK